MCGHLVYFAEVQLWRTTVHRDETFQTGILTLTRDEHSARRNKNLRIVLDRTQTKSTWRAQAQLTLALSHVGLAYTFLLAFVHPLEQAVLGIQSVATSLPPVVLLPFLNQMY